MFRPLLIISCLFFFSAGIAQVSLEIDEKKEGQLKNLAREAERTGEIYLALEYYKQLVALAPANAKNQYKAAELYRYTRNYAEAEKYYEQVCTSSLEKYPDALFYLAAMQKANGKHKEAGENLAKFKKISKDVSDERLKKLYKTELEGCNLPALYKDSVPNAVISNMGNAINNPHIDFSPIPVSEKELIFGSLRETEAKFYDAKTVDTMKLPVRKFYIGEKSDQDWKFKGELEGPFNSNDINIANGTFSLDRTRFYFTRCEQNWQYKMICKIWYSEKKGKAWSEPVLMDEQINMAGYTSTHPTMGRGSKKNQEILYFVSDRPGTRGGLDIWYSEFDPRKKSFKAPKNAGNKINTIGSEITPFYDVKTKTLYYSTDGKANIGGLDIYRSTGELNAWEPSVNLGPPVNSPADDLDFALKTDAKGGFIASNRAGGQSLYNATCCDDIYEFVYTNFIELICIGKILDSKTKDCIDNAKLSVYIVNGEDKYLSEEITVPGCDYKLQLRPGMDYIIEAGRNDHFNNSVTVSTKNIKKSDTLRKNIELEPIPVQPIVIPHLNYEFSSAQLTHDSKILLDTTLLLLLQKNPDIILELSSHTDSKGTDAYNMKLSQKRAESVVNYLSGKGIDKSRLTPKGYGETIPLAPNENRDGSDNPEGRQINRRTEFKVIGKIDPALIRYDNGGEDASEKEGTPKEEQPGKDE
ncbi:MAG TPA: OmpA family protein [Bacteroidia bacterium]|jgi:outer membrane protein OmpA-like peptidoglycan-associated protein/tetratricopeptide (TPR) repeat protein